MTPDQRIHGLEQRFLKVESDLLLVDQELCAQLSDIHFQLERIADHLENSEGNG